MVQHLALIEAALEIPGRAGPDLTRYVFVCAMLLLGLGGMAFLLRRMVGGTIKLNASRRSLQVLDVLPLGGKQRVCVVRCYDRTFALGIGEKEVGLIAEIDAAVSITAPQSSPSVGPFQEVLNRLRGGSRTDREEVLS
jgi:flagellar biogenesis protein FliO